MKSNQDRPEKFDEEIDAALKMLSETAPPAAMLSRVHQSLETAATTSLQTRPGARFWIPATCAAMTAAVLFVVFSRGYWTRQAAPVETVKAVTVNSASPRAGASQPALVSAGNYRMRERFSERADVRRSRREHPQYRHAVNLLSYPLTRQEKLLVRFVQTAKPADLQALNPEYQAKVEAQQEAEFAAYLKSGSSSNTKETAN
jgi:hypothetical protein